MHKRIVIFCLFLLLVFKIIPVNFVKADHQCEWEEAAALGPATRSISIDKSSYRAGDTIYVSGTSCTDQAVVIQIFEKDNGQKIMAQSVQPVACEDGFCYSTSFNTNYNQNGWSNKVHSNVQ